MALPPLIRQQGYYYCEICINNGRVNGGVPLFKRKKQNGWAKHINWIPLCDGHSKKHEIYT